MSVGLNPKTSDSRKIEIGAAHKYSRRPQLSPLSIATPDTIPMSPQMPHHTEVRNVDMSTKALITRIIQAIIVTLIGRFTFCIIMPFILLRLRHFKKIFL